MLLNLNQMTGCLTDFLADWLTERLRGWRTGERAGWRADGLTGYALTARGSDGFAGW